jgi:hypothetical protein
VNADDIKKLIDSLQGIRLLIPVFPRLAPVVVVLDFLKANEQYIDQFVDYLAGVFRSTDTLPAEIVEDWAQAALVLQDR